MQTYRRLDDRVRLYGLTVPGMIGVFIAFVLLYVAIRISPLPFKATATITGMLFSFVGALFVVLQGHAMNPLQYVVAVVRWRVGSRFHAVSEDPADGGVLVDAVPLALAPVLLDDAPEWDDLDQLHYSPNGQLS